MTIKFDTLTYIRRHMDNVRYHTEVVTDFTSKMSAREASDKILQAYNSTYMATLIRQYNLMVKRATDSQMPKLQKKPYEVRAQKLFNVIENELQKSHYHQFFWGDEVK